MARLLTFQQLRAEKGWPHSRQYTTKLVRERKIPSPKKRPGGRRNLWDEGEWDSYVRSFPKATVGLELTTLLVDVLTATDSDEIVSAVHMLNAAIEREGLEPD